MQELYQSRYQMKKVLSQAVLSENELKILVIRKDGGREGVMKNHHRNGKRSR